MNKEQLLKEIEQQPIIQDFDDFLAYFDGKEVLLTKTSEQINSKACFELNSNMFYQEKGVQVKSKPTKYPLLLLLFELGKASGLIEYLQVKSKRSIVRNEEAISYYESLNPTEKYFFLFQTFITEIDFERLTEDVFRLPNPEYIQSYFEESAKKEEDGNPYYHHSYVVTLSFEFFGWGDTIRDEKFAFIRSFTLNEIGKMLISTIVESRKPVFWNSYYFIAQQYLLWVNADSFFFMNEQPEISKEEFESMLTSKEKEPFLLPFKGLLPENTLDKVRSFAQNEQKGVFYFKVYLYGKTSVWRKIAIDGSLSMEDLHFAIRQAYGLGKNEQAYIFCPNGNLDSYFKIVGKGTRESGMRADLVPVKELKTKKFQKMLLMFFTDTERFDFDIVLEEVEENATLKKYKVLESKGDFGKLKK
jgi:hypothetical protein